MVLKITLFNLQVFLSIFILSIISISEGFKQELILKYEDGNGLYFHTHVPDASIYDLSRVKRVCATGLWQSYYKAHFKTAQMYWGYINSDESHCIDFPVTELGLGSFRYFGANDTTVDAVSLYADEFYAGEEILVTSRVLTDIPYPITSFVITGASSWKKQTWKANLHATKFPTFLG